MNTKYYTYTNFNVVHSVGMNRSVEIKQERRGRIPYGMRPTNANIFLPSESSLRDAISNIKNIFRYNIEYHLNQIKKINYEKDFYTYHSVQQYSNAICTTTA
jgi:hypothetical protein